MDGPGLEASVIYRSPSHAACRERALVLDARGIANRVIAADGAYLLLTARADAELALGQLAAYERENQGWPPPSPQPLARLSDGLIGSMVYAAIIVLVDILQRAQAFGLEWYEAGRVDGAAMRAGEWWRAATALTLHLDWAHLAGNLFFGALFGLFVGQQLRQGTGWLLIVVGGVLGNVANALVQDPGHRAVGASTAVFAALGVLTAYVWARWRDPRFRLLQRWAPVVSGLVLLAYLGTGDERTDIVAHLTGYLAGSLLGAAAGMATLPSRRWQPWLGAAALAIVALAWALAQLTAPPPGA